MGMASVCVLCGRRRSLRKEKKAGATAYRVRWGRGDMRPRRQGCVEWRIEQIKQSEAFLKEMRRDRGAVIESVLESKRSTTYPFTAGWSARTCFIFQNDSKDNIFPCLAAVKVVFRAFCKGVTGKNSSVDWNKGFRERWSKGNEYRLWGKLATWRRDNKTTGPNYTVPHTEWTPLTVSFRCSSPFSLSFFWLG